MDGERAHIMATVVSEPMRDTATTENIDDHDLAVVERGRHLYL